MWTSTFLWWSFLLATLSQLVYSSFASKVIELDDGLPQFIKRDPARAWLVKFYAPWCHYCRNLEPTYDKVAETIYHKHDHLLVGRLDCAKYSSVCQEFDIKSYPTLMYISNERRISYEGERFADSIVNFAERLHGPDIRTVGCSTLKEMRDKQGVVFVANVKDKTSDLWKDFQKLAKNLVTSDWFFEISEDCSRLFGPDMRQQGVFVLKANRTKVDKFSCPDTLDSTNTSTSLQLTEWAKQNRLPVFSRIGSSNLNRALQTRKMLVLALVEEYVPLHRLYPTSQTFVDMLITLSQEFESYDDQLLFGWTGDLDTINSIAIQTISPIPNLIVITHNLTYYMPENYSSGTPTTNSIRGLLRDIVDRKPTLRAYGGDSIYHRMLRLVYDTFASLVRMYHGNPILTLLLTGLPGLFLTAILYTVCCYDSYSVEDDETEVLLKHKTVDHDKVD
ncbi:Protein disulfide-isomerase TMX3 [Fragariocoptes setiger]|uniref:Protein disulfide-isomerase TMX3 n=1 Tax=Fragariocoptes setiger TaxID=1670756 RepID=A0ABQ7S4R6_9ACAR|nr:Protein disulfide-isomerase TMX3 [Fragariocoptes setiger]